MLNDVHIPPIEKTSTNAHPKHHGHSIGRNDANTARVRNRLPTATRSDVPEAIYGEPEDRGESFNTTMSASDVVIVVAVVVGLTWAVFL